MKRKKPSTRVLIYAAPALACAAALSSLHAAPEPQPTPPRVERRIEIRSADAAQSAMPVPPPAPVTFLGIEVAPVDEALAAQLKLPPDHGLVVRFVAPDSPAASAGVQRFDVLTRLDDQVLIAPRQLSALVRAHKEGDAVKLTYLRAGTEARVNATLTTHVPPPPAADVLRWTARTPEAAPFPMYRHFEFGAGEGGDKALDRDELIGRPADGGVPHVRIFHPTSKVIYSEGDVTLELTATPDGRRLEARGADGAVIFTGPIDTAEQRKAVPPELQKQLEQLDAIEPTRFEFPAPPAGVAPTMPPGRAHGADLSVDVRPLPHAPGAATRDHPSTRILRHATQGGAPSESI